MLPDEMKIADPDCSLVCSHGAVYESLLPLDGARILELDCGKAEITRAIAKSAKGCRLQRWKSMPSSTG